MAIPFSVLNKTVTTSTMDDARAALKAGYGHGTVCTARSQSSGRGRVSGRQWHDGEGDLLFTLILSRNRYCPEFPPTQALALALCRRLESGYGLVPSIKWPNDVLISGKKIAGILVETEGDFFLAGMGVNLSRRSFPDDLRRPATSIAAALERNGGENPMIPTPEMELPPLLEEIEAVILCPSPINDLSRRLHGAGREVTVRLGDPSRSEFLHGILHGLRPDGALEVLADDGRIVPVYSGEIDAH